MTFTTTLAKGTRSDGYYVHAIKEVDKDGSTQYLVLSGREEDGIATFCTKCARTTWRKAFRRELGE